MAAQNPSKQPGNLPSQGKQAHEQVNAISLRSGTTYQSPDVPIDKDEVAYMHPKGLGNLELSDDEKELSKGRTRDKKKDKKAGETKSKLEQQFGRFMEVVKNLQVSVPAYAKFLKEILSKKRSFDEVETVAFTQECAVALQANSPPKLKDRGSFYIPCHIDSLQMADISLKRYIGVLEDVSVRVGKYFIPTDFIVMDMAEESHVPIILGRPFLHTAGALIDVKDSSLTLRVGNDTIKFVLDNALKRRLSVAPCYMLNDVDPLIHYFFYFVFGQESV
ncbi:uncharacterized protein LOC141643816 [Silene latifolia]|uniref:uncharacterized protein LOC141643816 n=1 Tax=Silene latifolia TaxID=37657 RepID=UPI003D78A876